MPYITTDNKIAIQVQGGFSRLLSCLVNNTKKGKKNNGWVVYVIYRILKEVYGEGNFEVKSNALKVLESAKLEYYRRIMAPYEDKKIKENGDV